MLGGEKHQLPRYPRIQGEVGYYTLLREVTIIQICNFRARTDYIVYMQMKLGSKHTEFTVFVQGWTGSTQSIQQIQLEWRERNDRVKLANLRTNKTSTEVALITSATVCLHILQNGVPMPYTYTCTVGM